MGAPGWDDAPLARLEPAKGPTPFTIIWPYYENPVFLGRQIGWLNDLPQTWREHISLIVADDGSPDTPAETVMRAVQPLLWSVRLFRVEVDVRWNWLAARNIAFHHAAEGWCAVTDIDHRFPSGTILDLLTLRHDPAKIYRFSRREAGGAVIHSHPNSFFLTRAMFWKVGGYDETLSGFYGTDGDWRRRCAATAPIETLPSFLDRHEHQGDSSTIRYKRKQPEDAGKKPLIQRRKKGWRPRVLSFPYHEVEL